MDIDTFLKKMALKEGKVNYIKINSSNKIKRFNCDIPKKQLKQAVIKELNASLKKYDEDMIEIETSAGVEAYLDYNEYVAEYPEEKIKTYQDYLSVIVDSWIDELY